MKLNSRLAVVTLCLLLTGCRTTHKTTHLSNGYEEVSHTVHSLPSAIDPSPARVSFQYMSPDGKLTRIWPSLYASGEVIHGDLAIFVGDESFSDSGALTTRPRLFAVKAPALPVDITDEILAHWAKDSGNDAAKAAQRFSGVRPEASHDGLLLHLEFMTQEYLMADGNWPDKSDFQLAWDQVSAIMDTVKTNGIFKEDPGWHNPYIGKKF